MPYSIVLHKYKFDLIYTNTSTVSLGGFIAKVLRIPHLWHFREFGFEDHGYKYDLGSKISEKLTNYFSTVCLVNSVAVMNKYIKFINKNKLFLLYEAYHEPIIKKIEPQNFDFLNNHKFNCLMVGTLHEGKGHIDAIKAVSDCIKKGFDISLTIVGSGDDIYKNRLTDLISQNGVEKNVTFIQHLQNPKEIMGKCDVLLMCSRNEAFGLVTLEALEIGLPVIGTKSGGTVEIIEDNFTGLLYSPGNYNELASKIEYLFLNSDVRIDMGNNAKKTINRKFNPDLYISKTIEMIHKAID